MPFKRSLVTVLITLTILSCMSLNCFADVSYETLSDTEVKVSINFGEDAAEKLVGVTVKNPKKTTDNLESLDSNALKEVFSFVKQTTADAEGKATVTFTPTGDAGWYTVTAAYENCMNTESLRIPYVKQQAILDLIEDIKEATDDSVVRSLFVPPVHEDELAGYVILDLANTKAYDKVFKKISSDTTKNSIYGRLSNELKAAENIDDVKRIFSDVVFSEKLFSIENANELKQYIKDYDSDLGLADSDIYKGIYSSSSLCGSLVKPNVLKAIMDYEWTEESKADLVGTCEEIIFLTSLYHTNVYSRIGDMITATKEVLVEKGANLDALENVTSKTDVYRNIAGTKYADFTAFVTKLNEVIEDYSKIPNQNGTNKPSGGGGGGGGRVSISNELVEVTTPAVLESRFKDLDNVDWAVEAIEYLAEKGIVSGKEENKFYPNEQMTREEFAKVLVLSFDLLDSKAVSKFTDVEPEDWYYAYVSSANKKGIINGYGDSFGAGNPITRQDLATIVYRTLESTGKKVKATREYKSFADEGQISDYALESIKALYSAEIINGMDELNFEPTGFATRAQVAKIIYGLLLR